MKRLIIAVLLAVLALAASDTTASATQQTFYATGDIACAPNFTKTTVACHQADTAAQIPATGVTGVLVLGDNQYASGTNCEYLGFDSTCTTDYGGTFDDTWGTPFSSILHPIPGNHEYTTGVTPNAEGYKTYFTNLFGGTSRWSAGTGTNCPNDVNGKPCTWYSFNSGQWHVVGLDSQCGSIGGCGTGSPEYKWLVGDLNATNMHDPLSPNYVPCLLAMWHKPRWSSGANGSYTGVDPIWQLLANGTPTQNAGTPGLSWWTADLVLSGHDHDYEAFNRMDGAGVVNAAGIREIVAGAGGEDFGAFPGAGGLLTGKTLEHQDHQFGILELHLNTSAYTAQFRSVDGLHDGTLLNNTCHV